MCPAEGTPLPVRRLTPMTDAPRRASNNTDQLAREALADAFSHFPQWRSDVARFEMTADRVARDADRQPMRSRCEEIEREITDVRTELILNLAEAPQQISGHSRVVDIEKALDNIEAALRDVKERLQSHSGATR
jgi:hypothetical protein